MVDMLVVCLAASWKAATRARVFYCPFCGDSGHYVSECNVSSVTCHEAAKTIACEALSVSLTQGSPVKANGIVYTVTTK